MKDYRGLRIGMLTVIGETERVYYNDNKFYYKVKVKCDCGQEKMMRVCHLDGKVKSCGCMWFSWISQNKRKHKDVKTRLYKIWKGMKHRCTRDTVKNKNYYGRGIRMCNNWYNSFDNFKNWSINNGYNDDLTIDRIDNNLHYSCGDCEECKENGWKMNCRWTTRKIQNNNTGRNRFIIAFNEKKTMSQWAEDKRCQVGLGTLKNRINKLKWNSEEAILFGKDQKPTKFKKFECYSQSKSLKEWSLDIKCKVTYSTLKSRIKLGWDIKSAIETPAKLIKGINC